MKIKFANLIWGTFLLLAAAFMVVNQFGRFSSINIGSFIVALLSVMFMVQCIAYCRFAPLPIPVAVLYIIFQAPLGLPHIQIALLIAASVLASIGLAILLPWKHGHSRCTGERCCKPGDSQQHNRPHVRTETADYDNNPSVSVNFGAVSRRLQADHLETVQLFCHFGALEVFFDQTNPDSKGATADINCSFGAIQLFVPKGWHVIDRINCSLGNVDIGKNNTVSADNAPQLILTGSVSLGGIEVKYI